MKYLKLFEELSDKTLLEKISDINDIIESLRDIDFKAELNIKLSQLKGSIFYSLYENEVGYLELLNNHSKSELELLNNKKSIQTISLKIHKNDKSKFSISGDDPTSIEIKDSLIRIKSILNDWKFDMTVRWKKEATIVSSGRLDSQYGIMVKDDKFVYDLPPFSPLEINWPINLIRINFNS